MICENCKVQINNQSDNCPLCGKHLSDTAKREETTYPELKNTGLCRSKIKARLFLTILISIVLFTTNMLTSGSSLWSLIPISALWLIWLVFGIPIIKRRLTAPMIIFDNLIICGFLVVIDATESHKGWAMNYAVPFVLFGSALVITILVLYMKLTWREFYLYEMAMVIICFIPLILRLFLNYVFWPTLVSAVYSLITFIGMLMLGDKNLKYEAKKRFHF